MAAPFRLLLALALASPAAAEPGEVPRALTVTVEGTLEFGRVALAGRSAGAAELAAGTAAVRTDAHLVDLGGARYSATVRVTGQPGARVRLSWPATVTLRASGGGEPVRLDAIESDRQPVLLLDGGGRAELRLGARLIVPAGAEGDYRGPITVDAEYL